MSLQKKCFCSCRGIFLEKINAFQKYIFLQVAKGILKEKNRTHEKPIG